jgi:hypothetical protein
LLPRAFPCEFGAAGRNDWRKASTPQQSLEEVGSFLNDQADAVSAHSHSTIRALVLDATIEGSGPEPNNPKKKRDRVSKESKTTSAAVPD